MSNKEFNEKYKDFLEDGSVGLLISDKYPYIITYLDCVFKDLIKIDNFKYSIIDYQSENAKFNATGIDISTCFAIESAINILMMT